MNTRPAANIAVLSSFALVLVLSTGCCYFEHARDFHMTALSYLPPRSALEPPPCTPFYVQPAFYGHYGTCWRPWPEGWLECPCHVAESEIEEVAAPAEQSAAGKGPVAEPPMETDSPPVPAPEKSSSFIPQYYDERNAYSPPRIYISELAEDDRAAEPAAYNSFSLGER